MGKKNKRRSAVAEEAIVFIELLTSDVSIQDLWNILIRNAGMGDNVVQTEKIPRHQLQS